MKDFGLRTSASWWGNITWSLLIMNPLAQFDLRPSQNQRWSRGHMTTWAHVEEKQTQLVNNQHNKRPVSARGLKLLNQLHWFLNTNLHETMKCDVCFIDQLESSAGDRKQKTELWVSYRSEADHFLCRQEVKKTKCMTESQHFNLEMLTRRLKTPLWILGNLGCFFSVSDFLHLNN